MKTRNPHSDLNSLFASLGSGEPASKAAARFGFTGKAVEAVIRSAKVVIEANDSEMTDYLAMLEKFEQPNPSAVPFSARETTQEGGLVVSGEFASRKKQSLLDSIESQCNPTELRSLAATIMRLADAIDQEWTDEAPSSFFWASEARRIERDAYILAQRAKVHFKQRQIRAKYLPAELLGEPCWDMLLEMFCQHAGGAKVSVKSASIISGAKPTTALRYIERLEDAGLIARTPSATDGRVTMLNLTRTGIVSVGRILERYF